MSHIQQINNALTVEGNELFFDDGEVIVTKTNLKGHITYCNKVFLRLAGYSEQDCLGSPHNMIRHPNMPRCIFKLLWDRLQAEKEIFAYVVNKSKNGDYYWVIAHVTPSYDKDGQLTGYHSNRRVPNRNTLDQIIIPAYKTLLDIERSYNNRKEGLQASLDALANLHEEKGMTYDEWIFSIS